MEALSEEVFTESSMDIQAVTFPGKNFFDFDLGYDKRNNKRINDTLYDSARYDGNITGMTWKGGNDKKIRKYDFGYDPVSRLATAKFGQLVGSPFSTTPVNYNFDNLTYDGNGNMVSDNNKKITGITYNILNLPSQITVAWKGAIKYYYDASGNKLQKCTTDNTASPNTSTVTTYIGGAVYINDTLQFFGTEEGRVRANDAKTAWIYDYFLKDHLGNTRMMITDDYNVSSPILEAYSYYPFGLQQKGIGLTANNPLHNFKNTFQKQEFNEDLGVDLYEFKYRMDDPQIGRFWQIDPLADKYV